MTEIEPASDGKTGQRRYVRTFLFSMRLDAPLNRLHVITKFLGILILSFVLVRAMDAANPDPLLAGLLLILAIASLYLGGVSRWFFRGYLVLLFPMFLFLMLTWLIFTPDPGDQTYLRVPIYSGQIVLGISLASVVFVLTAVLHYVLTKKILRGVFLGLALALLISRLTPNPGVQFASFSFLSPYDFIVSDANLLIAGTKVVGYAAMVFVTLVLVMTTRDSELAGALRQVRVPYLARFFLAIFFRSLSLALMDFQTIRQAQIARGVRIRKRNIFRILYDLALMSLPLVATMLSRSSDIGDALLARGFTLSTPEREFIEVRPLHALDWLVILALLLLALGVLAFSANLYQGLWAA